MRSKIKCKNIYESESIHKKKNPHMQKNLKFQYGQPLTTILVEGKKIKEMDIYMQKKTHIENNLKFQ